MRYIVGKTTGRLATSTSPRRCISDVVFWFRSLTLRGVTNRPDLRTTRRFRQASWSLVKLADKIVVRHQLHQRRQAADAVDALLDLNRPDPAFLLETEPPVNALLPISAGVDTAASVAAGLFYEVLRDRELRVAVRSETEASFAGASLQGAG